MKLNALILDDEHSGRTALKILLTNNYFYLFHSITTAATLDEAILLASKNN